MRRSLLILLPAIGILIAFLLLEVALRTFYWTAEKRMFDLTPKRTTLEWVNNSTLGRRLKASQEGWFVAHTNEYSTLIKVNSKGWRDTEHSFEKPDVVRILILGDSFVENFQVPLENTFFRQLEERLNNESDKKYEIIAMGLGNTGTAQQFIALKEYGLKYNPDLVVQLFYTNDIKNNSKELNNNPYVPYLKFENGGAVVIPPNIKATSRTKELLKKSRLIKLLLDARQNLLIQKENKNYKYPIDYHVYDKQYLEEYKKAWELTEKSILNTKRLCDVNKIDYFLITIPAKEQVDEETWKGILESYKIDKNTMNLEKPDKLMDEFCTKNEINCAFSLPYFKNREKEIHENLFFPKDSHWTEKGTNVIADFLENTLISSLLNNSQ